MCVSFKNAVSMIALQPLEMQTCVVVSRSSWKMGKSHEYSPCTYGHSHLSRRDCCDLIARGFKFNIF